MSQVPQGAPPIRSRFGSLVLAAVLALPASGAPPQQAAEEDLPESTLRLAAFFVQSPTGQRHRDAIHKAIEEFGGEGFHVVDVPYINEKQGIETLLAILETGTYTKDGTTERIDVVLGPTDSGVYVEAHKRSLTLDLRTPVISSLVTAELAQSAEGWFFRTNVSVEKRAQAIYDYLNKFWIRRITVLYADSQFGRQAEESFRQALTKEQEGLYTALPFDLPRDARTEIKEVLSARPEALGILGEREDIELIHGNLLKQNSGGVPYHPFLFTILDARSISLIEKTIDIHFVSVIAPEASGSTRVEEPGRGTEWYSPAFGGPVWDDVRALSYDTAMITLELLDDARRSSPPIQDTESLNRVISEFRLRFVSALSSNTLPADTARKSEMRFSNFANRAPTRILHMRGDRVAEMDPNDVVDPLRKASFKFGLVWDRYGRMPLFNLFVIVAVVIGVSVSDLQRWNIGKFKDLLHGGGHVVWYLAFVLVNIAIAVAAFIWCAEMNVFQYDNVYMAIAVALAPATFAKANFFEVKGKEIGLARFYDQAVVFLNERVRLGQDKVVAQNAEILAFYNSYKGLQRAWNSILRETCTVAKRKSFETAVDEELANLDSNFEKRKVYARWLMRVASWEKLKQVGCIPDYLDENAERENPVKVIRESVRYCTQSRDRQDVAHRLVLHHLEGADEDTLKHYKAKVEGRSTGRDYLYALIQMLHMRFDYDAEMLRMCGLLPPKIGDMPSRSVAAHGDEQVRVYYYDRAPHLRIGERYVPVEYDATTETYATHHLPFTRYESLTELARDYIDFRPRHVEPQPNGDA